MIPFIGPIGRDWVSWRYPSSAKTDPPQFGSLTVVPYFPWVWQRTTSLRNWLVKNKTFSERSLYSVNADLQHILAAESQCTGRQLSNPCATNNGGCAHLCIITTKDSGATTAARCACNIGYRLNTDNRGCLRKWTIVGPMPTTAVPNQWWISISAVQDYLLFSSNKLVRGIVPDGGLFSEAILPLSPSSTRLNGLYYDVACDSAKVNHIVYFQIFQVEPFLFNISELGLLCGYTGQCGL